MSSKSDQYLLQQLQQAQQNVFNRPFASLTEDKNTDDVIFYDLDGILYKIEVGQQWAYKSTSDRSYRTLEIILIKGAKKHYVNYKIINDDNDQIINHCSSIEIGDLLRKHELIKKENHMKDIFNDIKGFLKEHRSVIYTVVLIAALDHFFLDGKFRHKLKDLLERALTKAHKTLEDKTEV